MKKFLRWVLIIMVSVACIACGKDDEGDYGNTDNTENNGGDNGNSDGDNGDEDDGGDNTEEEQPSVELINIPDESFKAYLVGAFDTDQDGEISVEEAQQITDISYGCQNNTDIVSIEGIEHLTNLQKATHAFDGCTSLKYVPDLRFTINNEEADPADFSYMFLNCDALENINAIAFTGDGYFNATQMFGPIAPLKALKELELSAYPVDNGVYFMFGIYGSDIETIDSIVLREGNADYYGLFWSLPNLQTATFTGKCMPYMICMHTQEKLSVDSFQSLFEALLPVDDGRGIRLGDYNKSRIPDEVKQIALDKGYQLDTFYAE